MSRGRGRRASAAPAEDARPAPEGTGSPWLAWASAVAAAVAFLVYAPSLGGGFIYDDGEIILRNPAIRALGSLGTILRYEPARPLLTLTWALNYALGGTAAWHYHLVNVLIHGANAALLVSLFSWMGRRQGRPEAAHSALLGACLFAASPMAAETVAYVASRSSALVALFSLASLRVAAGVLGGAPRSRLAAAVALFLLALATKEEAAAVPLLLLLLDYFFVAGQRLSDLRRRSLIHACFLGLLVVGFLARRFVTGTWLPPQAVHPGLYLLTQWAAFPLYFFRALVPFDPALYRHHLPASWPPEPLTVGLGLLTLVMALLAWRRRRELPDWSFAVSCLAAGLLPSSSVVSLNEMVVDHRAYLGSFGIAFALGGLVWKLGRARLGIVVVALFAARAVAYQWVLADPVRAWEDAVRRSPDAPDALCALGESYAARNDPRAEAVFLRATRLQPGQARYWANLGLYYSESGRPAEAAAALRNAADKAPRDATIHDYLGMVLRGLGRDDEAEAEFEAAIAAEPAFAQAYINLAELSLSKARPDRARALLESAAQRAGDPDEFQRIESLRRQLP